MALTPLRYDRYIDFLRPEGEHGYVTRTAYGRGCYVTRCGRFIVANAEGKQLLGGPYEDRLGERWFIESYRADWSEWLEENGFRSSTTSIGFRTRRELLGTLEDMLDDTGLLDAVHPA